MLKMFQMYLKQRDGTDIAVPDDVPVDMQPDYMRQLALQVLRDLEP